MTISKSHFNKKTLPQKLWQNNTSLRCSWQTRATQCLAPTAFTSTVSVINWWSMTVTRLPHWSSTYADST